MAFQRACICTLAAECKQRLRMSVRLSTMMVLLEEDVCTAKHDDGVAGD